MSNSAAVGVYWDKVLVESYLVEAAYTLMRLPDAESAWMRIKAFWPEYSVVYGEEATIEHAESLHRRLPPSKQQLARYERILSWLQHIDSERARMVVMAAAMVRRGNVREHDGNRFIDNMNWEEIRSAWERAKGRPYPKELRALKTDYMKGILAIVGYLAIMQIPHPD